MSFEGFFVYLRSEEGRVSGEPSPKGEGETSSLQQKGNEKGDNETVLLAQQLDEEKIAQQEEVFSKEQVVEIIKHGVVEQKVFLAQDAPEENPFFAEQGKGTAEPREEEQPEADVALPGDEHNTIKTVRTGAQ